MHVKHDLVLLITCKTACENSLTCETMFQMQDNNDFHMPVKS